MMHKVTEIYQPPHVMSPAELAACRRHLERQWETQRVDAALLQCAWHTVHQVAAMLYQDFDVTQVAVFGSLTERGWFTEFSDIDVAVWGLSRDAYWDALGKVIYFGGAFKIDLTRFENAKGLFRERVQQQAILIKNGDSPVLPVVLTEKRDTYESSLKRFVRCIADERQKTAEKLEEITEAVAKFDTAPVNIKAFIEDAVTLHLAKVYDYIENIFLRIARDVDRHVPSGRDWREKTWPRPRGAYDLLCQMAQRRIQRPPVLSPENQKELKPFLKFRNRVKKRYLHELDYKETEKHAKRVGRLFQNVCDDLGRFTDALTKDENEP